MKDYNSTSMFHVEGFQTPFRKDNESNGGWGIMVYVRNGINAKRRKDLEINEISCIWLEISQNKGKPFLIGNMYLIRGLNIAIGLKSSLKMHQKRARKSYY